MAEDGDDTLVNLIKFRPWLGKTVSFSEHSTEGRAMIERGILEGVVINVRNSADRKEAFFELEFGPAGNKQYSEFTQDAFLPPNGPIPSAKTSATKS